MGTRRLVPAIRPTAMRPADPCANASAATAAVLFGASVVAVRVAVRDVPPISLAVLRMGKGGLLLAVVLLVVAPGLLRVRWERLRLFALPGFVLFAAFSADVQHRAPVHRGVAGSGDARHHADLERAAGQDRR
jgi:hypothetical protein